MSILADVQSGIGKRLAGCTSRERRVLIWGGATGVLLILVLGSWLPLQQAQLRMERSVVIERKRLAAMTAAKLELASLDQRSSQQAPAVLSRQIVEESARTKLSPDTLDVRMEGEQRVKIVFSGVQMPKLIEWIAELSRTQRIHLSYARFRMDGAAISGELQFSGPEP